MRQNLIHLVAFMMFALLIACGGSGGGGNDPDPEPIGSDTGVAIASSAVLANAAEPDAALQDALVQIQRVYQQEEDPDTAADIVANSSLGAVQSEYDFGVLLQSMKNSPSILAPQFDTEVTPQAEFSQHCGGVEGETIYYFVNGIWTIQVEAESARQALAKAIPAINPDFRDRDLRLFYNQSGIENESLETFCQAVVGGGVWEDSFAITKAWKKLKEQTCAGFLGGSADIAELIDQWALRWLPYTPSYNAPDVVQFRNLIQQDIISGKRVIIIAHSQGNFFAQQAVDQLPSDEHGDMREAVGVIALASPANYLLQSQYGFFDYLTLEGDIVLRGIGELPANGSNEVSRKAIFAHTVHNFLKSYIGSAESKARIQSMIRAAKEALYNPRNTVSSGVFQVTIVVQSESFGTAILDVSEPSGSHVGWGGSIGTSGELEWGNSDPDLHDIHYSVCSRGNLQTGTYRIGYGNYNLDAGDPFTVFIRAGTRSLRIDGFLGPTNFGATITPLINVVCRSNGTFTFGSPNGGGFDETGGK